LSNHGSKRRILAVASAGGHFTQLSLALTGYGDTFDIRFVTTRKDFVPPEIQNVAIISDFSKDSIWRSPIVFLQGLLQIFRFRPSLVVSTGAAPGLLLLIAGRCLGRKTIWIDSCANVDHISRSGRFASYVADLCLTQWPELQSGKFKYIGSIL